jgi:hypothetical protein
MSAPLIERIGRAAEFQMSGSTRRHLRMMDASRRALLEAEWAAGEDYADREVNEAVSPEIRARAAREWNDL